MAEVRPPLQVPPGEMGARITAHPWASTELGPVERWPDALRTAVGLVLSSRFPMLLWWGPQLIQLYNDAYRPVLGDKHPRALGAPGAEVWREIWHIIGPLAESIQRGGPATWNEHLLLPMQRRGYLEETYFTFSYSAVPGEDGALGGVLVTCQETTAQVLSERRLRALQRMTVDPSRAASAEEAGQLALQALGEDTGDVPFALLYLVEPGAEGRAVRTAAVGLPERDTPAVLDAADPRAPWAVHEVLGLRRPALVSLEGPLLDAVPRTPDGAPRATRAVVLPLEGTRPDAPAGLLVAGLSAQLEYDERYQGFVGLAARHLATAVNATRTYAAERRRAEALAELDRAKTAFFSNVSHEFRTPLTLLLGPLEEGLADVEAPLPGSQRARVEGAHRNALRLLKLVNTLLDFSRIEAGRVQAHFRAVDLASFTAELASTFRSLMERGGLRLQVDCPPLAEPVWVDPELWEKVVLNLLSNAFKFTLEGEVRVALRQEGPRAVLRVEDTGTGIPAAELPRLFERFHRVEGARGRSYEGSGIGLALVQELVRLHGGSVEVQSQEGRGTRFEVAVPLGRAHLPGFGDAAPAPSGAPHPGPAARPYLEEAAQWAPAAAEAPPPAPTTPPSAAHRILLADDNADMRDYVRRLLEAHGWQVEAVTNGEAALRAAQAHPPELVLTDVMMPGLDGLGLVRALRADPRTRHVSVVMLSARVGDEARLESLQAGADDYLVKPFGARDLAARVAVHLELARSRLQAQAHQRQLHDLFESAPAFIAVLRGSEHRFELANPLYRALIGGREPVGRTVREVLPELEGQPFFGLLDEVYRTGRVYRGTEQPVQVDHSGTGRVEERFLTFVYQPMRGADGEVEGVLAFGTDVTEQVHARQRVEALMEALREADQRKDEFLAMLAHELRNPLAAVSMALAMLERHAADPARVARHRDTAVRQLGTLVRLVDDLLDVSRITRGKVELRRAPVELDALVHEAVAAARPAVEARQHVLRVSTAPGPYRLEADRTRLEQVVANLLTNAAKYTEPGGRIDVELAREPAPGGGAQAVLRVRDTGRGIAPEALGRVFDLFVQVDTSIDRSAGGLGIGLTLVRRLVELHGGSVSASSAGLGRGSEFVVRLPLAPEAARPAAAEGGAAAVPAAERRRVVLVEDGEDVREVLQEFLLDEGHEVAVAADGLQGVQRLLQVRPDVALVDVGLPGIDGYEVARRVRAQAAGAGIYLVALTGYGGPEARARAVEAGFDLHLTKPVNLQELVQVLARSRASGA